MTVFCRAAPHSVVTLLCRLMRIWDNKVGKIQMSLVIENNVGLSVLEHYYIIWRHSMAQSDKIKYRTNIFGIIVFYFQDLLVGIQFIILFAGTNKLFRPLNYFIKLFWIVSQLLFFYHSHSILSICWLNNWRKACAQKQKSRQSKVGILK